MLRVRTGRACAGCRGVADCLLRCLLHVLADKRKRRFRAANQRRNVRSAKVKLRRSEARRVVNLAGIKRAFAAQNERVQDDQRRASRVLMRCRCCSVSAASRRGVGGVGGAEKNFGDFPIFFGGNASNGLDRAGFVRTGGVGAPSL